MKRDMLLDIAGLIGSRLMFVIFGFGTGIITARTLGIVGAALSTAISYSLAARILLTVFVRESGCTIRDTVLVGADDLARYAELLTVTGARLRRSGSPAK